MSNIQLRRVLPATAATCLMCSIAMPAYATYPTLKWCEGVKIAAFAGGFSGGDWFAKAFVSGFHQAEIDLGPSVYVYYSQWNRQVYAGATRGGDRQQGRRRRVHGHARRRRV